ncbi:MAG: pyridoxal kinase [Proteobacteria bacterium]|nr:pyridoxal kinase [Pseudomonadota bacterium]
MAILSIQSNVTTGHVGNAAATLPLQRLGFEVWPVDIVTFSNHPAHETYRGRENPAVEIAGLIDGIEARGLFSSCTAVLSGYLGQAANGRVTLNAVKKIKKINKRALFLCDPVLGDQGKLYVSKDILDFYKDNMFQSADIITPNSFEAELLTGQPVRSRLEAMAALRTFRSLGIGTVVITGMETNGTIESVALSPEGVWVTATPKIPGPSHGAGDLFSALFLAKRLKEKPVKAALSYAISVVYDVLNYAYKNQCADLPIVAAQNLILDPITRVKAEKL